MILKKLLGIVVIGFYRITRHKLGTKEIKQGLNSSEQRKRKTLLHTSYADNLQFIKNKSHKDSLKTLLKLDLKEINQMVNSKAF